MVDIIEKPMKFCVQNVQKHLCTLENDRNISESSFEFWIKMPNYISLFL